MRVRPLRLVTALVVVVAAAANLFRPVRAGTLAPVVDVWAWGSNAVGQLGVASPNQTVPWPTHDTGRWVAVSAGTQHTLVLSDAGEVWAWGGNSVGELGDGTRTPSLLPIRVVGLPTVEAIAAGASHNVALATDGTVWAWGSNGSGQLGQPVTTLVATAPLRVTLPAPALAVSAGGAHTLALLTDGSVYAWGANATGQLGVSDFTDRSAPVKVPLPRAAVAIAAGGSHSVAALSGTGEVWTWGWNVFGQLGWGFQGKPEPGEPTPAPALNATNVVEVSAGDFHCLARTADGHVWAWGYNTEGQVGNGANTAANTGVLSPVLLDIDSVAAVDAGGIHSIVLKTNGEVWTWGNGQSGACGDDGRADRHTAVQAMGIGGAIAVSAGQKHSVALAPPRASTRVVAYGTSGTDPSLPTSRPATATVPSLGDVIALSSGRRHTLALDAAHQVWAWGDDSSGQLGTESGSSDTPMPVDVPLEGAAGIVQIVARADFSVALRSDGSVWTWGDNAFGQLGSGTTTSSSLPARVTGASGVVTIAAGERHVLAQSSDGYVYGWGENGSGQLGMDASDRPVTTPARVPTLTSPAAIAAGGFDSLAIDGGGRLVAWGSGYRGQLGRANPRDSALPVAVAVPFRVSAVSAGRFHSVAILEGGGVWAFGDDAECQLGVPPLDFPAHHDPQSIALGVALMVGAGDYHSVALLGDGRVAAWGDDTAGQLGQGDWLRPHFDCKPTYLATAGVTAVAAGRQITVVATASPAPPSDAGQGQ